MIAKRIVGDVINYRGMVHGPANNTEFARRRLRSDNAL
jgi:hypothetical protein